MFSQLPGSCIGARAGGSVSMFCLWPACTGRCCKSPSRRTNGCRPIRQCTPAGGRIARRAKARMVRRRPDVTCRQRLRPRRRNVAAAGSRPTFPHQRHAVSRSPSHCAYRTALLYCLPYPYVIVHISVRMARGEPAEPGRAFAADEGRPCLRFTSVAPGNDVNTVPHTPKASRATKLSQETGRRLRS